MAERVSGAQQENLLSLLAHDDRHGQIVARLINPDLFESDYRIFAERFVAYWRKHKKAPGVHAADLFADVLDDQHHRKRRTYERILRQLGPLHAEMNTDYVMESLKSFSRLQEMKDAILKAAEKLQAQEENSIQEVEEMLSGLLRARTFEFDKGLTLLDVGRIVDYFEHHYSEFRLGIKQFDDRSVVPMRNGVFLFLAPTGGGKTWFLIHTGKHALLQRKKVLHVTLEIDAEEVAQRYYQALYGMAKRDEEVHVAKLLTRKENGRYRGIKTDTEGFYPDLTFDDGKIRTKMRALTKDWRKRLPNLIIKRFPTRGLTIEQLRGYIESLEASEGFIPDMIILDYVGIMNTDAKNHRISLGRTLEDFRGLCSEWNASGVTAAQVSRKGAEALMVKTTHVSEDWSLIGTADIAVTYSQTEAENKLGLARLFVPKARSDKDKFGVVITQSYATGQFALQSVMLNKSYEDDIKAMAPSDDDEKGGDDDD